MKKFFLILAFLASLQANFAQKKGETTEDRAEVTLQTTQGKIIMELYNETPLHRDNFLAQVRRGYYDGLLFHRIISQFMIQCGDSTSRGVPAQEFENARGENPYRIPAEIRFPQLFHRRGALAAARQGDHINPERKSSPYEFYIVWGKYYGPREMQEEQYKVMEREDSTRHFTYPQEVIDAYEIDGGTPHLDNEYTVFGEVIKGLDVVGQIQAAKTDSLDRPIKDIRIKKAWVSKELK
jgi:peptidyl-prolyl cis-trans isomerase B (cyclophilin B)